MNTLTVLLLCLAAAYAVPVHFPAEKTVIYKYYADVKAGIIEPAQYASQFVLAGELHIKKDVSDPTLSNAYYVKLQNVKHSMYNGKAIHHQSIKAIRELGKDAQQIQDPFLIVYDKNGKFQGIKLTENESGWSRNIKQGIASMMQLDLSRIQLQTPMKPHGFVTTENTIHGACHVAYDVHAKLPAHSETNNVFVVTKLHDLKNCSHFVQRVFNQEECEKCHVKSADDMTTAARRVFQIEQQDNVILMKHLVAHSVINYFPYNARSEAHYLLTNTTLSLDGVMPTTEVHLPTVNFQNMPLVRDVTFNKPLEEYVSDAAEDLTHGRHILTLSTLVSKVKTMLAEAAHYLDEYHLDAKEPEWKHGQTINRLQHIMGYLDLASLEKVYEDIQDPKTPKEVAIKNIFLQTIPTVGTTAACQFTLNYIRKDVKSVQIAITMLVKLPMKVKVPSEELLLIMEDLLKLGNTVHPRVRNVGILCFSNLIRKTYIHQRGEIVSPILERYLHDFFHHVKNDKEYEMKLIYLMAMRNVQVGNIEKLLEPIIRGEVSVSEHPHNFRVQAIWAIKKAVADKVDYTHDLLWPILADVSQSLPIRIMAYDVLMSQLPNMQRIMNIYWLMVYEQNNDLYNYHLTTLKGLANSVDPCLTPIREMARKILRYTRIRPVLTNKLSLKQFRDYTDPMYEHGESWNTAIVRDELYGLPHIGYSEYRVSVARKLIEKVGIYWRVDGLHEIMKQLKVNDQLNENITNENVQKILNLIAQSNVPSNKDIFIDFCTTLNGQVVVVNHYDHKTIEQLPIDLLFDIQTKINNNQEITYNTLYEMQVPTDMGLQAVFSTKMPCLFSIRVNDFHTDTDKESVNVKFEADTRIWRHGEYAMSIHNPIVDVWHSIRRATTQDIALPMKMYFSFHKETNTFRMTVWRYSTAKPLHVGIRNYAKTLVTITEDEQDILKTCCSTCQHHAVVTTGEKKNYHVATDSKDLGLKYSKSIFDCESKVTPMTDVLEWHRALSPEHKNTFNEDISLYLMAFYQKLTNNYISPEMGKCGFLMKAEPSVIYFTSHIDLSLRINVEDVDYLYEKMHALNSKKINIHGTLDARSSTNVSLRSWDMNANIDISQGHVTNDMKLQITRVTPGEKKLKICLDTQDNYPKETDYHPRMLNSTMNTNAKMTITAGFTDGDKCVHDEMLITMTAKGEMTEEQKNQMMHDSLHGACAKDITNLQSLTKGNHPPKTLNCIRESILYTTMRKYTVNASYKKIPMLVSAQLATIDDRVRAMYLPYMRYIANRTENGNAKTVIEFPADLSYINATVVTPNNGYEYVEVSLRQRLFEGMIMGNPAPHWGWHVGMANTYFTIDALRKVKEGLSKICTVYPQLLITLNNAATPFAVSDQWTLASADYDDQTYAVFAKSVQGDTIAARMYVADHVIEIAPSGKFNATVIVDGNAVVGHEKGVLVTSDKSKHYAFRLTADNERLMVQSQLVPVTMLWTPNSVTVMVDNVILRNRVTGICGRIDDARKEEAPGDLSFVAAEL